jgi:hypothetical protein
MPHDTPRSGSATLADVPWTCSECGIDRKTAERRFLRRNHPRTLRSDSVTCGSAECKRERERRRLRERYGPGTAYAAAHRERYLGRKR